MATGTGLKWLKRASARRFSSSSGVTSFGRSAPVTTVPAGAVVVVVLDAGGSVVVELAVPAGSAVVDVVWAPGSPEGS